MADRYWVGGTGTWNTTSTSVWSSSSGGSGGASVPTAADNVIFDQASTYTVTMTGALNCLDFTVSAGSPTFTTGTGPSLNIAGSLTLNTTTTWSLNAVGVTFTATTSQTINTNGTPLNSVLDFNGSGGTWTLQGPMTNSTAVDLTQGTLNLNSYQFNIGTYFQSGGSLTRTVDFGASGSIRLTRNTAGIIWNTSSITNFSVAGTPLVITATSGAVTKTINAGALSEANSVSFQLNDTAGTITFGSGNAVRNLTVNGTFTLSNVAITIYGNYTQTAGTQTAGTNALTFAATSGTKTISAVNTQDFPFIINGVGGTFQLTSTVNLGATRSFTLVNGTFDQNSQSLAGGGSPIIVAGGSVILRNVTNNITQNSGTATLDNNTTIGLYTLTTGTLSLSSYTLTCLIFSSSNSNIRTIDFGTGKIVLNASSTATIWTTATITNLTISGTNPLVECIGGGSGVTKTINTGALNEASAINFSLLETTGTVTYAFTANNTVKNLIVNGTQTISNIAITIYGSFTHQTTNGATAFTAGANAWTFAGTSSYTITNVAGFTYDFPWTFNGVGGSWTLANNLVLGSAATRILTLTNGTLDVNNKTVTGNFSVTIITGSVTLNNTGGSTLSVTAAITHTSGTLTLGTNLTTSSATGYTLTAGTLALGTFILTTPIFSSSNSNTRTLSFGTGKIVLNGSATATIWTTATVTGLTVSGTPLVECIGGGTAVIKTINTGSLSEANAISFSFLETTGTVTYTLTANSAFKNLIFNGLQTITNTAITVYGSFSNTTSNGVTSFSGGTSAWTFAATSGSYNITTPTDSLINTGSVYTNGTSSYLSLAGNVAFAITTSTTPFTIEAWIHPLAAGSCIFSEWFVGGSNTIPIAISLSNGTSVDAISGQTIAIGWYTGTAWVTAAMANTTVLLNQWTHVACVFTGSTTRIYLNGVDSTKTSSPTPATTWGVTGANGDGWFIGKRWDGGANQFFSGYISNFRFVKGIAVYTGAFSPPTLAPLETSGSASAAAYPSTTNVNVSFAASSTSLLTCQSTTAFVDNSNNAFTVTAVSSPVASAVAPSSTIYDFPWTFGSATSTAVWQLQTSVTISFARQLTLTNGTTDFNSKTLSAAGITILTGAPTIANTGTASFTTTLPITHTSGSLTLPFNFTTSSATGYTFTAGTLALSSFTLTTPVFSSSNANTRTLNFGTGKIIVNSSSAVTVWTTATVTNLTVLGTSLVEVTGGGAVTKTINTGGLSEANSISFSLLCTAGTVVFTAGNTVKDLTINGTFTLSNIAITIYGNYLYTAATALTAGTNAWTFGATSGTKTINLGAGPTTHDFPFTINGVGGTFQLATNLALGATRILTLTNGTFDQNAKTITASGITVLTGTTTVNNLNVSQAITHTSGTLILGSAAATGIYTLTAGTLNLSSFTLTTPSLTSSGSGARTLAFGTGQLALTSNNTTIFDVTTATNFSTTGTVYINSTYTGATGTRTFVTGFTEAQAAGYDVKTSGSTGIVFGTTATDIVAFTGNFNNFDLTGLTNTLSNTARTIYGNFTIPSTGGTITAGANATTFSGSGTETITTNGRTIDFPITVNGTGTILLAGNLTLGSIRTFTLTAGTIDLASFILTCNIFSSSGSGTRTVAFGTGQLLLTGNAATIFDVTTATNFSTTGTVYIVSNYTGATGTRTFVTGFTEAQAAGYDVKTSGSSGIIFGTTATDIVAFTGNYYNFDLTGLTNTLSNTTRTIYGNLTIPASGGTLTAGTLATSLAGNTTQVLTTNGRTIDFPIIFGSATSTGSVQLAGALTLGSTRIVSLTGGTLDLNNFTTTAFGFSSLGTNVRVLAFGTSGQLTLTGSAGTIIDMSTATNFSYTGTPKIYSSYSGATGTRTFNIGGTTGATSTNVFDVSIGSSGTGIFINAATDSIALTGYYLNFNLTSITNTLTNTARTIYGNTTIPAAGGTLTAGTSVTTLAGTSTPNNNGYSTLLNTNAYISTPAGSFCNIATGEFTIEMWVFPTSYTGTDNYIISVGTGGSVIVYLLSLNVGKVRFHWGTGGWGIQGGFSSNTTLPLNTWSHFACVADSSNNMNMYINGVLDTTGTFVRRTASGTFFLGTYFNNYNASNDYFIGYISNFRIVLGSQVYTGSSYTVPTTPLTDISGTSLLMLQNSTFIDNGPNDLTLTPFNSPLPSVNSPFVSTPNTSTVTTNRTLDFPVTIGDVLYGIGNVQLATNLVLGSTRAFTLVSGNLETNNLAISSSTLVATGSFPRSINFSSSGQITVSGSNAAIINIATATNFSYSGTPKITSNYTGATGTRTFALGNAAGFSLGNTFDFDIAGSNGIIISGGTDSLAIVGEVRDLDLRSTTNIITNSAKTVYGNFYTSATGGTYTAGAVATTFAGYSGNFVIDSANRVLDFPITFNGNGNYSFSNSYIVGSSSTVSTRATTLSTGNVTIGNSIVIYTGTFVSNTANVRSLNFSGTTGQINLVSSNTTIWNSNNGTNLSFSGNVIINSTYTANVGTRVFDFGNIAEAQSQNVQITTGSTGFNINTANDSVTLTGAINNLNLTGLLATVTNSARTIYGNLLIPATGGTFTAGITATTFGATSGVKTIDTTGRTLQFPLTFNGVGGNWTLSNALVASGTTVLTLTNGTVDFNQKALTFANITVLTGNAALNNLSTSLNFTHTSGNLTILSGAITSATTGTYGLANGGLITNAAFSTGAFTQTGGNIILNADLTAPNLTSNNSTVRSIQFGTSNINVTSTGTVVNMTTTANLTSNGTGAINITNSGSTAITVTPGALAEANTINYNFTAGTYSATITAGNVKSLNFTGFTGTVVNTALSIFGNVLITTGPTLSAGAFSWTFSSNSIQTLTSNAKTLDFPIIVNSTSGSLRIEDNLTLGSSRTTTLTSGTLNLNNLVLSTGLFSSTNSNNRIIAFADTGKIQLTANTAVTYWNTSTTTNFAYTGNSNIETVASGAVTKTINTGIMTEAQALNFTLKDTAGNIAFTTNNTVNDLTINGTFTLTNVPIIIYGDYTYTAATALTAGANAWTFGSLSTQSITASGVTHDFPWTFNGGQFNLQSAATIGSSRLTTLTSGLLDLNGYTYSTGVFTVTPALGGVAPQSVSFDGSGDYCTVPSNTAFNFGTGDFTIECWFNISADSAVNPGGDRDAALISSYFDTSVSNGWAFAIGGNASTTGISLSLTAYNGGTSTAYQPSTTLSKNTWYHGAVVRSGNTVTVYVNGTSIGSTSWTVPVVPFGEVRIAALQLGAAPKYYNYFNGYISNLRVVKGVAVYTSNFTPSTAPLSAITGTSLLTCQYSTFTDYSTNNFTITVAGNTSINILNPFDYNSVLFDGTTDFLTAVGSGSLVRSNGSFTIEGWYYPTSSASSFRAVYSSGTGYATAGRLYQNNTTLSFYWGPSSSVTGTIGWTLNTWNHFAVTWNGTTTKVYVNGQESISSNSPTYSGTTDMSIGESTYSPFGYISNFRIVSAIVYASPFSVPTAPLTAIANTVLLTCQSDTIVDNSGNSLTITANGNASVDTLTPFGASVTATKRLQFDSGTLALAGSGVVFNNTNPADFATIAGNATGTISLTSSSAKTFAGSSGNYLYANLNQGGTGTLTITGNNIFNDLSASITSSANATISLAAGTTTTVATFSLSGNATYQATLNSVTQGTRANIASTVSNNIYATTADYIRCRDIGFTPYTTDGTDYIHWYIGNNSLSLDNNMGAIFQAYDANTSFKVYVVESGSSWTIPPDFNVANNTIHLFGGGGGGGAASSTTSPVIGGSGGGGAGYTKVANFFGYSGQTVSLTIGSGGNGGVGTSGNGNAGGQTTFSTYSANGGGAGGGGRTGVRGSAGTGATFNGGLGGISTGTGGASPSSGGSGGGGAGGFQGVGANGGNGQASGSSVAGAGGGGGGGGTVGGNGGLGGNNYLGFGGGTSATSPGFSGGGGVGVVAQTGGRGSGGIDILNSFGAGGGGAGGGSSASSHLPGGVGGKYGGGGGGAAADAYGVGTPGGAGANGVIIVAYLPGIAPIGGSTSFFLLF